MKVAVVGTGYVGLVSGACFAELGQDVTCIDNDTNKICQLKNGKIPIFEPGLKELVDKNVQCGCLHFSEDRASAVRNADIVFIAVGTPTRVGGREADLSYVFGAAQELAREIKEGAVVVTKSTVPVGTTRRVYDVIRSETQTRFHTVSNPEFLREGAAIADFMHPDRIVVGSASDEARSVMQTLYAPLVAQGASLFLTHIETAELIKYASNTFLAMKIAFINQIADISEACGADVAQVAQAMGLDTRIGPAFFEAGPGFGGSCFPKDTRALAAFAHERGVPVPLIDAIDTFNEARKRSMAGRVIQACGGSVHGKQFAILGATFKANTDDMRESASLALVPALREAGAQLRAFDPGVRLASLAAFDGVEEASDALAACSGADAAIIVTEWDIFKNLPLEELGKKMRKRLLIDFRNLYEPAVVAKAGFSYISLGRPAAHPEEKMANSA
ncbi:MAG: UDP-glucose/GDP-mannose dehydrogenase family protein [Holosporales bacterium]|jgi:UDPglucose 6-dehydrogenase|nr:UDP-glucose/GDP-mannose dehydrogenase family protein [Holosporales bacterium]